MKKIAFFLFALLACAMSVGTANAAVYFKGSMNGWGTGDEMVLESTNVYVCTVTIPNGAEFKINDGSTWYGCNSTISAVGTYTFSSSAGNAKWSGSEINAKVTYNKSTKKVTIEEAVEVVYEIPEEFEFLEGQFSVFFINTKKWSTVNVHIWNDGGANYTGGSWPGQKMEKLDVKSGDYECLQWTYTGSETNTPAKIIFNNGSGAQTNDLAYVNGGVYTPDGKCVGTVEPTVVVQPTITLGASSVNPYAGDKVTFTASVLNGDDCTVEFYIDDVKQTTGVSGNTFTYTFTTAGVYNVEAKLLKAGAVVTSDAQTITVKEATVFYVYLEKSSAWTNTYLHCWGDESTNWPGKIMSTVEEVEGVEYLKKTFNNVGTVNIIFNDNAGNQTANIEGVTKTMYYRLTGKTGNPCGHEASETPFVAQGGGDDPDPEPDPVLYIIGAMTGWSHTALMDWDAEKEVFTWTGIFPAGNEFLFTPAATWDNKYGSGETVTAGTYSLKAGGDNIKWGGDEANVTVTVNKACTSMTIEVDEPDFYEENVLCEQNYFLIPGVWNIDNAWFAAYFENKNTGDYTWVKGEMNEAGDQGGETSVTFYLSQYNVPTRAADMPVYTHITFCRMNANETEMNMTNVWNKSAAVTYTAAVTPGNIVSYRITGWNVGDGKWEEIDPSVATGLDRVEAADAISYAYGVVTAQGAIEVYNINGVVVARGNDTLDLRGLSNGIYVVRCGDAVRKVVR